MVKQYYYLIASLPELRLDDYKEPYRVWEFKAELFENLVPQHYQYIKDMLFGYDIANMADVLLDIDDPWTRQKGRWEFTQLREKLNTKDCEFADYITNVVAEARDKKKSNIPLSRQEVEDELFSGFYRMMITHKNFFIREYFKFGLDLRNILAALNKRKFGLERVKFIDIEKDEVVYNLQTSNAADFGLSRKFIFMPELIDIFAKEELVEMEKYIDHLRWQKIDEINIFSYFDVDVLLGYLLKLMLVERWINLDTHKGREVFEQITKVEVL
ncbi:MAG: hypothetical protein DRP78_01075 [Candidatus Omnitrophota bacterium]|nr:MAG: hypothetical protein DRP78_01075 [Candidatus Omnitrophota bacterium]